MIYIIEVDWLDETVEDISCPGLTHDGWIVQTFRVIKWVQCPYNEMGKMGKGKLGKWKMATLIKAIKANVK